MAVCVGGRPVGDRPGELRIIDYLSGTAKETARHHAHTKSFGLHIDNDCVGPHLLGNGRLIRVVLIALIDH